jgi:transcriptional regulator with XRE-family HTH domain
MNIEEVIMVKLKEIRQAKGLSQSQLAEKAELNVRTLQHYEQGSKTFDHARLDTILKCAIALECKIEDIIDNEEYLNLIQKYQENQS